MYRIALVALLTLAACSDREVGQSVYFDGPYVANARQQPQLQRQSAEVAAMRQQIAERQAQLAAEQAAAKRQEMLVASLESAIDTADQRANNAATMPSTFPDTPLAGEIAPATPTAPTPTVNGDGTISDNSFSSVTARESIESDAARLARLQQGTVVLEAEPVPERADGVNLAAFARGTTHRVGQRIYRRSGGRNGSAARVCRRYGNPDEAQRDFLAKGGPERDSLGIDPDGDGFVCGWTPDVLRSLRVGG